MRIFSNPPLRTHSVFILISRKGLCRLTRKFKAQTVFENITETDPLIFHYKGLCKRTDREFAIPAFTGEWPWTIPTGLKPRQGIPLFFPGNKRVVCLEEDRGKKPIERLLLLLPTHREKSLQFLVSISLTQPNFSFPLQTNHRGPLKFSG
jgi:hypothetical protein